MDFRHFVQIRDQMVSQLELEATRNVIFGVTSLLFFTAPWVICTVLGMVCYMNVHQQGFTEEEAAVALFEQCSRYPWASFYCIACELRHIENACTKRSNIKLHCLES